MIDGITMQGKRIIMSYLLQRKILEQLYSNNMGIEKMRLLARDLVCWINMDADIENTIKQCVTYLEP